MKWIIAPDRRDAEEWLQKHIPERGELYHIITDQTHAEGAIMFPEQVIFVNYSELDHDLLATVEDNIANCEAIRRMNQEKK